MYKKILPITCVVIFIAYSYRSIYWWVRDYYYQVKLGAFMVDYELQGKDRLLYQASVKALTPADLRAKIDTNYFTAVGYHEWQRVPTVYPYTMNGYSDFGTASEFIGQGAFLTNSKHVDYTKEKPDDPPGGVAYMNDAYGDLIEENIIAFSFNDKYLIGKKRTAMENSLPTAESITSYFMFEFVSGKMIRFTSYKELMKEAKKRNYKRHRFYLDYTRETKEAKEYKEAERNKFLKKEETELFPFQLLFDRFTGMVIEL
jgi:hypothetical protein